MLLNSAGLARPNKFNARFRHLIGSATTWYQCPSCVNGEQDKVFVKEVLSLSPSLYSFKFHFWGERGLIRLRDSISRRKTWYPNIFQFFFGFRTLWKTSTFTDICCCNCLLTILDLKTSWKLLSITSTENHYSNYKPSFFIQF